MNDTTLTICGPGQTWQVRLNPQGTVVGRNPDCDVVIDSREVSRRHAEILRTSPDQWMIRDLGSSNGTFVNGKRVESSPLAAADVVEIGPASLLLGVAAEHQAVTALPPPQTKITIEDFGTEVFYDRPRLRECTTQPYPQRLLAVKRRLSELTTPGEVYAEVCLALAQGSTAAAAVLRIPPKNRPMPRIPEVLACRFGSSGEDTRIQARHDRHPSHQGFRVSRRLLETVREKGCPLMAKCIFSCDTAVTISLIDEHSPRALLCAPLGSSKDAMDLFYVDVPIEERAAHGPEEMFAFVQAVAEQAASVLAQ